MYSPAARPSRKRAPEAKKRRLSIVAGISSSATTVRGLPTLADSMSTNFTALARGRVEPVVVECLAGRLHGAVDVLVGAPGHLGDHVPGGRIQHLLGLATRRGDPVAPHEHLVALDCRLSHLRSLQSLLV